MMRLLILTQYFPPETGAPQNRLYELAIRLKQAGADVTVLTAMPNYPQMKIYAGYEGKTYVKETMDGMTVHRSSIYIPKSKSIVQRLMNYFSFVYSSARAGKKHVGDVDVILCESPPLFLGWSALYLKRKKRAKLVFNVSDLWPESAEKLGVVTNRWMLKLAYNLEAKLYKRSALVTGQTQGICNNIKARFPQVKTYWLPNGVDMSYYNPETVQDAGWRNAQGFKADDVLFLYAGIIGLAQGLEVILEAADRLRAESQIHFILLGNGPEKAKLQKLREEMKLNNVHFVEGVGKKEMPAIVRAIDVSVVPLKKMELFLGAIPSKIFENLAMEKPLLLGVDGEARELFINSGHSGLYVEPENPVALANGVLQLAKDKNLRERLGKNGRLYVEKNFNRDTIATNLWQQLSKL